MYLAGGSPLPLVLTPLVCRSPLQTYGLPSDPFPSFIIGMLDNVKIIYNGRFDVSSVKEGRKKGHVIVRESASVR